MIRPHVTDQGSGQG